MCKFLPAITLSFHALLETDSVPLANLCGNRRWGFDEEGELRTMWRRTGHPGFWFFGGNLALCRYFSRMLALQIKAMEERIMKYEDP